MTVISDPISIQSDSPQRAEPADDFVDRLSNPPPAPASGPMATGLQILISFGLLPLMLWPTRWVEFLESERSDLLELTAWWRRRVDNADAVELDKITNRLRPRPLLMVLPWLAVAFNFVVIALLLSQGDIPSRIWKLTFDHAARYYYSRFPLEQHLYGLWLISLFFAYTCQWYAVRSHAVVVHSLVDWTNKLGRENQIIQIKDDALRVGLGAAWIILGIVFCGMQAWWALPMMFAGAMQRRYITRSSPAVRQALADQARDGFAIASAGASRLCRTHGCSARLPAAAQFCPRCGTAV